MKAAILDSYWMSLYNLDLLFPIHAANARTVDVKGMQHPLFIQNLLQGKQKPTFVTLFLYILTLMQRIGVTTQARAL